MSEIRAWTSLRRTLFCLQVNRINMCREEKWEEDWKVNLGFITLKNLYWPLLCSTFYAKCIEFLILRVTTLEMRKDIDNIIKNNFCRMMSSESCIALIAEWMGNKEAFLTLTAFLFFVCKFNYFRPPHYKLTTNITLCSRNLKYYDQRLLLRFNGKRFSYHYLF
jgi:hypothetical protein